MSTWEPIIFWSLFGVLVLAGAWGVYRALFHDRSRGRPRCPKCWYDMTGAPSLTCPECGHDARTEQRLHKTRRRWRVAVVYLLLIAVSVYWIEVRARLFAFHEPIVSAAIPTTVRILAIFAEPDGAQWGDDNRAVIQRRVATGGDPTEKLWGWQRYLYIEGLYQRSGRLPANARWRFIQRETLLTVLLHASEDHPHALERVLEMIRRHPNMDVRAELLQWLPTSVPIARLAGLRAELLPIAEEIWPDFSLAAGFVSLFPPEERFKIDDASFERELRRVLDDLPGSQSWVAPYLAEAVRRRSPRGDAMIASLPIPASPGAGWNDRLLLMVMTAKARIAGREDPVRLVLTQESQGVRLKVIESEPLPWLDLSRGPLQPNIDTRMLFALPDGGTNWGHVNNHAKPPTIAPPQRDIRFPLRVETKVGTRLRVSGSLGWGNRDSSGALLPISNTIELDYDGGAPEPSWP